MVKLYKTAAITQFRKTSLYAKRDVLPGITGYEFQQAHYFDAANPSVIYSFFIEGQRFNNWTPPDFTYDCQKTPLAAFDLKTAGMVRHVFFRNTSDKRQYTYLGQTSSETSQRQRVHWVIP